MKKELNKKEMEKNLSCDLIFVVISFYQIVLSKIMKNLRIYVLVMYFGRKSNLRLPNKLSRKILT